MPFPATPEKPKELIEGAPEPLENPELAEPVDKAMDHSARPMGVDGPEPDSESEALPMDLALELGADDRAATVLTYLREATAEGLRMHTTVTSCGAEPLNLADLILGLRLPDGTETAVQLPATQLELGETWEADLVLDVPAEGLQPGASLLCCTLAGLPDAFARI